MVSSKFQSVKVNIAFHKTLDDTPTKRTIATPPSAPSQNLYVPSTYVIQWGEENVPIEVKAKGNISGNSLSEYNRRYNPKYRIRFSMLNLQFNGGLLSSPSPLAG